MTFSPGVSQWPLREVTPVSQVWSWCLLSNSITWEAEAGGLPQAQGPRVQGSILPGRGSGAVLGSSFHSPCSLTCAAPRIEQSFETQYIFLHHKPLEAGPVSDWPELSLCHRAVLPALGQGEPSCRMLCGYHGPKRTLSE